MIYNENGISVYGKWTKFGSKAASLQKLSHQQISHRAQLVRTFNYPTPKLVLERRELKSTKEMKIQCESEVRLKASKFLMNASDEKILTQKCSVSLCHLISFRHRKTIPSYK